MLFRDVVGRHRTGDTHWVVYDLEERVCFMAFAEYGTSERAYTRTPIYVDFKPYFNSMGKIIKEYNN